MFRLSGTTTQNIQKGKTMTDNYADDFKGKTVAELLAFLAQPMVTEKLTGEKWNTKTKKADLIALCVKAMETPGQTSTQAAEHVAEVVQNGVYEVEDTKPEPTTVVPNRVALRRMGQRSSKRKVTVTGKVMGLHYKGRALGLKHYQAMGLAIGRTTPPAHTQTTPLPNSERVQNYVRGNPLVYPKLTHNQWRRVRKHLNPFKGLNDVHPYPIRREVPAGYSKLAVTPDGRFNVLMQFAR